MKWHIPNIQQGNKPDNFSLWVYLLVMFIGFIIYCLVMLVSVIYYQSTSVMNLIINLVLAPFIMGLASVGLLYSYYRHKMTNYLFQSDYIISKKQEWYNWIRQHLYVNNYTYITGVENPAIKIIGLDGLKPLNANTVVTLSALNDLLKKPLDSVIEKIMTPLLQNIQRKSSQWVITIFSTYPDDITAKAFADFCQTEKLNINQEKQTIISNQPISLNTLTDWLDEPSAERLVIILDLHYENHNRFSEFACAFTLSSHPIKNSQTPSISVYRLLESNIANIADDFNLLINSEQTDNKSIRHLWNVNLSEPIANTLITEITENELLFDSQNFHRLNTQLGVLDLNHGWLAMIFACEAANNGQKGQIVSQQDEDKIYLVQVEKSKNIKKEKLTNHRNYYPISYLFTVILFLLALCFIPQDWQIRQLLFSVVLGGGVVFAVLLVLSIPLKLNSLTRKYESQWHIDEER